MQQLARQNIQQNSAINTDTNIKRRENEILAKVIRGGCFIEEQALRNKLRYKYTVFLGKLSHTYQPKIGKPKTVNIFLKKRISGKDYLILPRSVVAAMVKLGWKVETDLGPIIAADVRLQCTLFENQKICVEYLLKTVFNETKISNGTATTVFNMR